MIAYIQNNMHTISNNVLNATPLQRKVFTIASIGTIALISGGVVAGSTFVSNICQNSLSCAAGLIVGGPTILISATGLTIGLLYKCIIPAAPAAVVAPLLIPAAPAAIKS